MRAIRQPFLSHGITGRQDAGCTRLRKSNRLYPPRHTYKPKFWQCGLRAALASGLCIAMSACSASNSDPRSQSFTPPATAQSNSAAMPQTGTSSSSLDQVLKKDMAYADARKMLLAHGWKPEKDFQCKANVGANAALCKATPNLTVCRICDEIPELSAYSDEGDAAMHFTQGGKRLTINASGSISDWNVPGNDSRLSVSDWQTTP